MSTDQQRESIIYVGACLDEAIVRKRGLRTANAAGSNRLLRIASALHKAHAKVLVISQAESLRQRFTGRVWHASEVKRMEGVPVLYSPSIGLPFVGLFFSPLFLTLSCLRMIRRRECRTLIVYNYSCALLILCLTLRIFTRVRILNNVEDISVPKFSDWRKGSETSAIQQIVFYVCMKAISLLSYGSLIPSRRFIPYIKTRMNSVVTGCISCEHVRLRQTQGQVNVFYAGKIQFEHGAGAVAAAIKKLVDQKLEDRFCLVVSGPDCEGHQWLRRELSSYRCVRFMGFLSREDYQRALSEADICLALQNDCGRYSDLLVPSKTYEFLAHGKAVISTSVGDLADLPPEIIRFVDFAGDSLARSIGQLIADKDKLSRQQQSALEYSKVNFEPSKVGKRILMFLDGNSQSSLDRTGVTG